MESAFMYNLGLTIKISAVLLRWNGSDNEDLIRLKNYLYSMH